MVNRLFASFLDDRTVYYAAEIWWIEHINQLVNGKPLKTGIFRTILANGEPFLDGNPMYSAYESLSGRALRIIQQEPDFDEPELTAWLNRIEGYKQLPEGTPELVINLELTREVLPIADRLVKAWFVERRDIEAMQALLDRTITVPT